MESIDLQRRRGAARVPPWIDRFDRQATHQPQLRSQESSCRHDGRSPDSARAG